MPKTLQLAGSTSVVVHSFSRIWNVFERSSTEIRFAFAKCVPLNQVRVRGIFGYVGEDLTGKVVFSAIQAAIISNFFSESIEGCKMPNTMRYRPGPILQNTPE